MKRKDVFLFYSVGMKSIDRDRGLYCSAQIQLNYIWKPALSILTHSLTHLTYLFHTQHPHPPYQPPYQPTHSDVCTKYQEASKIINLALQGIVAQCLPGASIIDISEFGRTVIISQSAKLFTKKVAGQVVDRGVAFPVCISVNDIVCNHAPLESSEERVSCKSVKAYICWIHIIRYKQQQQPVVVIPSAPRLHAAATVLLLVMSITRVGSHSCSGKGMLGLAHRPKLDRKNKIRWIAHGRITFWSVPWLLHSDGHTSSHSTMQSRPSVSMVACCVEGRISQHFGTCHLT